MSTFSLSIFTFVDNLNIDRFIEDEATLLKYACYEVIIMQNWGKFAPGDGFDNYIIIIGDKLNKLIK